MVPKSFVYVKNGFKPNKFSSRERKTLQKRCIKSDKNMNEITFKGQSRVDKIIVKKQPYQLLNTSPAFFLKDKSGVDKIIVKKQPYQLPNRSREFFPSFDASSCHKLVDESL